MLKSYKLPTVLKQEEDYESFYDSPGTVHDLAKNKTEDDDSTEHFMNEKEAMFYREDVDFMRFHKRTTKNVHEELQSLIDSAK